MSETEKPLYVQVAEALGLPTNPGRHEWDEAPNDVRGCVLCGQTAEWEGPPPEWCAARYDADWSATGLLIEKHRIWLHPCDCSSLAEEHWVATRGDNDCDDHGASTPLVAVCHLILALKEAGKL